MIATIMADKNTAVVSPVVSRIHSPWCRISIQVGFNSKMPDISCRSCSAAHVLIAVKREAQGTWSGSHESHVVSRHTKLMECCRQLDSK